MRNRLMGFQILLELISIGKILSESYQIANPVIWFAWRTHYLFNKAESM